jgi:hypothetical protein
MREAALSEPKSRHEKETGMSSALIFQIHLALGYVPWLFFLTLYVLPRIRGADPAEAQRAIAVLHSFRFFGLVFLVPGVVGANLPPTFATFAAYGDFATGILAMLALFTFRIRPVFWFFTVAFNVMGAADILTDYYHGTQVGLPELAGQLGAAYAIPILFVPLLMITHGLAFNLMARARTAAAALQPRRA